MKVLVIGDTILDIYVELLKSKSVQELPSGHPAFDLGGREYRLGGAAHVAQQMTLLGCKTVLATALGVDTIARELLGRYKISYVDVANDNCECVSHKTRLYKTNRVTGQKELVARFDEDRVPDCSLDKLSQTFLDGFDIIILSDYNKGVLKKGLQKNILCPFIVCSPKDKNLQKYKTVSYFVMNTKEFGEYVDKDFYNLGRAKLVVTNGEAGATLQERAALDIDPILVPAPETLVQDVTGAGDVLLSVFSNGLILGHTPLESLKTSVNAASQSCRTFGTSLVERVTYDQT